MKKNVPLLLLLFFLCSCSGNSSGNLALVDEFEGGRHYKAGAVSVLQLQGTHYQMGRQYGMLLKDDLSALYNSMIATFSPYWTYGRMKQIADAVYAVYPQKYKDILVGMAETSGLGMEKQIILNAIEFIPKIDKDVPHCSGIAVWVITLPAARCYSDATTMTPWLTKNSASIPLSPYSIRPTRAYLRRS